MRFRQHIRRVAAHRDIGTDTGRAEGIQIVSGTPCQIDMGRAGSFERLRRSLGQQRVIRVRRAQAGDRRTAFGKCFAHVRRGDKAVIGERLDAAGGKELLRKGSARVELEDRAEIGEEYAGRHARTFGESIGRIAQVFERFGQPAYRQRLGRDGGVARVHLRRWMLHDGKLRLFQRRIVGDADQLLSARRQIASAFGRRFCDDRLDMARLQGRQHTTLLFDLLE